MQKLSVCSQSELAAGIEKANFTTAEEKKMKFEVLYFTVSF